MAGHLALRPLHGPSDVTADDPFSSSSGRSMYDDQAAREAYDRYVETRDIFHLDTAIHLFQRAIDVSREPDPEVLGALGYCLKTRLSIGGKLDDLERAVLVDQVALDHVPDKHPSKPIQLNNLGGSLVIRFERLGDLRDLEPAIELYRRAVELDSLNSEGVPCQCQSPSLNNLGCALRFRFERLGELEDLEHSIAVLRRADELTSDDDVNKPVLLNNLAGSLSIRFELLSELDDLIHASSIQWRVVDLTPEGHPDMPKYMHNLGASLLTRFVRVNELSDLERAIYALRYAVELTPDCHPDQAGQLVSLANALYYRFKRLGELEDLEHAIVAQRRAIVLAPKGHLYQLAGLHSLGLYLRGRFDHLGELEDLQSANAAQRRGIELAPDGHPDKLTWLVSLAITLAVQLEVQNSERSFNEALSCFITAITQSVGAHSERLKAAEWVVGLLISYPEFNTPECFMRVHSCIIDILPDIVWLGHSIKRRFEESGKLGRLVNAAVNAAIGAEAHSQAIEWLEAGRALIWSQVLLLRGPLDDLEKQHPDLFHALRRAHAQLQSSVSTSSHNPSVPLTLNQCHYTLTIDTEADRHRGLAIQYGIVLADIRRRAGFEDFLCPKKFAACMPSSPMSLSGPVVFINVDRDCCDALILSPEGNKTAIELEGLTLEKAEKLRSRWQSYLRRNKVLERGSMATEPGQAHPRGKTAILVLGRIWRWIVQPVLQALGFDTPGTKGDTIPHITWCPTGPLTQLPLHAAGLYDQSSGPRIYDYVMSSYTPSLSALARGIDAIALKQRSNPSVLLVTQPDTPELSELPGTVVEGARVHEALSKAHIPLSAFDGKQASVDAVRTALNQHSWLHLACHGSQSLEDPMQSAFALYDGPLTLADLMETTADDAELAFLSACQTAVGDEKIPEESMHLAAGMLAVGYKGVVATMWSIRDEDAPLTVEAYYKKLLELRASGMLGKAETGAAYALHEAAKRLREKIGEKEFLRWAPFVHFGI